MRKQLRFLLFALIGFLSVSFSGLFPTGAQQVIPQNTYGAGWTGVFFNDTSFTNHVASAFFPTGLHFSWAGAPRDGTDQPIYLLSPPNPAGTAFTQEDNFSVRFASTQAILTSGNYIFSGFVDDQARIYIGGIEVHRVTVPGNFEFPIPLTAGQVTMMIEYVELSATATLQFQWRLDSGVVYPTYLPPNYTPPPPVTPTPAGPVLPEGPIGQVINVRGLSLRTGPYLGASYIGALRPGIAYPVLAQNSDEGSGIVWYKVQNGPYVGWASGRYFTVINGTPPVEQTVFEALDNPQGTGVLATPNAYVNMRRRPSLRASRLGTLQVAWGDQVEVLGRTVQGGQNSWLLVRYNGVVGWVFAPYFRTTQGGFYQVPVY